MTTKKLIIFNLLIAALLCIVSSVEAAPEWQVTIWFTSGDGKVRLELGADSTATDGLDKAWDSYAMLGGQLRPHFSRPDWHPAFQKYWRDIRAKAPGNTTEWPFVVESDMVNKVVTINWDLSSIPGDYPLLLVDDSNGQTLDMRTNPSYSFPYTGQKNLRVRVYAPAEPPKNQPPVANAGPDQIIELASCDGATVVLDGSKSNDPDGDALTYLWAWDGGSAEGPNPTVALPMGTTTLTLTVDDGKGYTSSDTVKVSINDTSAATLNVSVSPNVLWPPNHKMVKVTPTVTVNDVCVPKTKVELLSVTSNEPDNAIEDVDDDTDEDRDGEDRDDSKGRRKGKHQERGDFSGDIVINPDGTVLLRAERSGHGSGRIYSLTYVATDLSGNQTTGTAQVVVPLNKGKQPKIAHNEERGRPQW